jgi:hypothetical protein
LVYEIGVNLAGVQRLLSVADAVQRLRPLAREEALARSDGRRRLVQELERLSSMLGV